MTTSIDTVELAKRAAKKLKKHVKNQRLSNCQEYIAQALGFRDWYHLNSTGNTNNVNAPTGNPAEVANRLAKLAGIQSAESLHVLTTARIFGSTFGPAGGLAAREEMFARQEFSSIDKNAVGAVCRVKTANQPDIPALLIHRGGLCKVMTDHSIMMTVDSELISQPGDTFFIPMRFWMPYGIWTESDNTKVIFSREYCPLWKIVDGKAPERDNPDRWVTAIDQKYYFNEKSFHDDDATSKGLDILKEHGVVSTPKLVEWLPKCLNTGKKIAKFKKWR